MNLHHFRVGVRVTGFRGVLFTGKFVKTLLINVLPEYVDLFRPVKGNVPKLVHVSPLYRFSGDGVRCIYSYVSCSGDGLARCSGRPSVVELNGVYVFYVGFTDNALDHGLFVERLIDLDDCFTYMGQKTCVSILEFEYVNPRIFSREVAGKALREGRLKIVFASPTMLRDPFRRSKYKSLLPNVLNIFSTPLYIMLYNTGTYSLKRFRRQLLILHKIFSEPYSVLKTIKLKWIIYKKKPEPTITGYINLRINREYLDYYGRYIDMEEYLGELLAYMATLGVGVGRAAGFGHVFIET